MGAIDDSESYIQTVNLGSALYYSVTALCCYDYCLTLGDEIQYIWASKRTLSVLLFCGFRYPAVFNTIFVVLGANAFPSWQSEYRSDHEGSEDFVLI
ncbi:uncharacterized protein C8Q71DRAFT_784054 [Rhodofomes roseus]|uniref:DUF6533 domain-containing protein n=1 Tax=Rhodofomes roseus TaxID=34475 RepID=A0ABQ8K2K7_9APHY|nr:uncharacterized protein C8Q71DRAFT_784054 [Rhodofomes roseus]KAH9831005.1 hypothetical protein C8Q71DRAFT_784054 [Rhodofomes roseus]